MSVIKRLLDIKDFRERKAAIDVSNAQAAVDRSQKKVAQTKKDLRDYQEFMIVEEKRLFEKIYNTLIKVSGIEDVRAEVAYMKQEEIRLEEVYDKAENDLSNNKKELKDRQKEHQNAMKIKQKYIELYDIIQQKEKEEEAYLSSEEMDEIALTLSFRPSSFDEYSAEGAL